jgi:hypothetical protein
MLYNRGDMSPEPVSYDSEAPMSEPSRLAGVLIEPGKAFRDIAARPRWVVPLVLTLLAAMTYVFLFGHRGGWEPYLRQTLDRSSRTAQLTPERKEEAIARQSKILPIASVAGAAVVTPVYNLAAAAVLLFIFNTFMSAELKFRQMFAIMCYGGLPHLIFSILAIVVLFLKGVEEFNFDNPLAFNPGAFLDPLQTSKSGYALASSLDLFSFWTIVLVATGIAAAGRKIAFGKALVGVTVPWAVLVLAKAGMANLR